MNRRGFLNLFVWCVIAAVFGLAGWFFHDLKPSSVSVGEVKAKSPAVAVDVVKAAIVNQPEEFVGHVEPVLEVDLLPQIDGYLKEQLFKEGDTVKEGDLLFVIDPERYAAADAVAKAALQQAQGKVSECLAAVDRSERYLNRLSSADSRGVTETEKDAAETGLAADRAALASAKAAVSQAEATIAQVAFELKHTKIYAPISGRIGKALRHAGDYVSPSKGSLARIVQTDPVRVTFPITDRAYLAWGVAASGAKISDTRRLRLRLANGTDYGVNGTWEFADNEMSTETATLIVRALFPNSKAMLVPNAYVTVLADEADPKPVPAVPVSAIAKSGGRTGVWTLEGDVVRFREVTEGARMNGLVHVTRGVGLGDTIVIQGVHKLGEGMKVLVVPAQDFN